MKAAAFFDLDGTLIDANSAALWIKREKRRGKITRWQEAQALFYLLCYRFGFIDMEAVTVKALKTVRGLDEETVRRWTHDWFREEVIRFTTAAAHQTLDHPRSLGHSLVLLTSASPYESEAASDFFGLDAFLCSIYEVKEGILTGNIIPPLCYGRGKVIHAEKYAAAHGIDLGSSYFYTDSITDLPMMLRVGYPRAVNPDPRLAREARRKGWPILFWKK